MNLDLTFDMVFVIEPDNDFSRDLSEGVDFKSSSSESKCEMMVVSGENNDER